MPRKSPYNKRQAHLGDRVSMERVRQASFAAILLVAAVSPHAAVRPAQVERPRVIVLTDIGNEADDSESMVRFLLYSNEFDVEGLLAVTSAWLRSAVHPELIEERVRAY